MSRSNYHFARFHPHLLSGEKVAFLVGSGISIDSPACLPSGRTFLKALISGISPNNDVRDKILDLCTEPWRRKSVHALSKHNLLDILRFEQIVGIVAESVDPYLNVLRLFDAENRPNENHRLLASLAKQGHYIFTTNFDGLLETAMPNARLRSVITAEDYSLARRGRVSPDKSVFKLHGSWRDSSGRLRSDSIKATIERVAKNGICRNSGSSSLRFFREVLRKHHLVIVGYSGWDDFDVIETLLTTDSDKTLVWVDHSKHDEANVMNAKKLFDELDDDWSRPRSKAALNLVKIFQNGIRKPEKLILMEASTTPYLRSLIGKVQIRPAKVQKQDRHIRPDEFIRRWRFQVAPYKAQHWYLCGKFFNMMGRWDSAAACFRKSVSASRGESSLEPTKKAALSLLAAIDCDMGRIMRAERAFRILLPHYAAIGNATKYCDTLHSLAICAHNRGDDRSALLTARRALHYARAKQYKYGIASISNFIGGIHATRAFFSASRDCFENSIKISRSLGDLRGLAAVLSNLGDQLISEKRYLQASRTLLEALNNYRKLNDYQGQSITQNKFGMLYAAVGDTKRAKRAFREQLHIDDIRGDFAGQAIAHLNLALVADNKKEALIELEEAESVGTKIDDKRFESRILKGRGRVLVGRHHWFEAANYFRKSLRLQKKIGYDPDGLSTFFHLAECLQELGEERYVPRLLDTAFSQAKNAGQHGVAWYFRLEKALILKDHGCVQECLDLLHRCFRSGYLRGDFELACQSALNIALIDCDDGRCVNAQRRVLRQLVECLRIKDREQLGCCLYALGQVFEKQDYIEIASQSYLLEQFVWSDPLFGTHKKDEEKAKANFARTCTLVPQRVSRWLDRQKRNLSAILEGERLKNSISPDWLPQCIVRSVRKLAARARRYAREY